MSAVEPELLNADAASDTDGGARVSEADVTEDGDAPQDEPVVALDDEELEKARERAIVDKMWVAYREVGDPRQRDALILHYAPLVRFVAARLSSGLPASVDVADLISYGMVGLIDAIERYEPSRGRFETYGTRRIRGAILDELRAMDWVPRSVRTKARDIDRETAYLEGKLGRPPTEEELAERLDCSVSRLRRSLDDIGRTGIAPLDAPISGTDVKPMADRLADHDDEPSAIFDRSATRQLINDCLNAMRSRDRTVVALYYFERLTLAQIGDLLGVSESRVSQLHSRAVGELRERLDAAMAA